MRSQFAGASTFTELFVEQGFVHVPSLGPSQSDFAEVGALLDRLFDGFDELPRRWAHDLGAARDRNGQAVLPEILEVSILAPALRRTAVYRAAHRLARSLLGPGAFLKYDHAIYKPPGGSGTTSWHQDSGFDIWSTCGVAIWIPLQDTETADGAMRYVPRSHLAGRLPHLSRVNGDGKDVRHLEVDDDAAVNQPCLLGGVIAHDLHTIHGAGPNLGSRTRRALILDYTVASWPRRSIAAGEHMLRSRRHSVL